MIDHAIALVEEARVGNPECAGGLVVRPFVHAVKDGPFGGPELLGLLFADDADFGYFYGHVAKHPDPSRGFAALLVRSEELINTAIVPLLFQHFHYLMTVHHAYMTLPIPDANSDDLYSDGHSFPNAAGALASMIRRFDFHAFSRANRDGPDDRHPQDMRIIGLYGQTDYRDENGCYPPAPVWPALRAVKKEAGR